MVGLKYLLINITVLAVHYGYGLMLTLVLLGVGYTGFSEAPIRGYWVILTPIVGAICVASVWASLTEREHRLRLIWTQAAHWAAVLAAMELMSLEVTRQVSGVASALGVLTLLALGTFTAGLHIRAWKIAVVGVILGVSVPAIALLEQSALFILLVVLVIVAIGGLKVTPAYLEYLSVKKAVAGIVQGGEARGTVTDIRRAFDKRAQVDGAPKFQGMTFEGQ